MNFEYQEPPAILLNNVWIPLKFLFEEVITPKLPAGIDSKLFPAYLIKHYGGGDGLKYFRIENNFYRMEELTGSQTFLGVVTGKYRVRGEPGKTLFSSTAAPDEC